MHRWLLALLLPFVALGAPTRETPPLQTGEWRHSTAEDWQWGFWKNLLLETDALRLSPGRTSGEYLSSPLQTPFAFNAGIVQWRAQVGEGQELAVDVRGSVDGQSWSEWQPVRPPPGIEDTTSHLLVFDPASTWLQYRVRLAGGAGTPILHEIRLVYINSSAGPSLGDIGERIPLSGPSVLTPSPHVIPHSGWSLADLPPYGKLQVPRRVELPRLDVGGSVVNPPATLRALRWVAQNVHEQPHLPFHFVIDEQGNIYQTFGYVTTRLPDAEVGTVRIALLTTGEAVSEAMQTQLGSLLGWLVDSYGVDLRQHDAQSAGVIAQVLPAVERSIVRSRSLFATGAATGAQRLGLFNPGSAAAHAVVLQGGPDHGQHRALDVPPDGRVDLALDPVSDPSAPGMLVEANRLLYTERTVVGDTGVWTSKGTSEPARTWYFSAGTTEPNADTTLFVANAHGQDLAATLVLYPDGSEPVTHTTTLAARSQTMLPLRDFLPDAQFGFKLVAEQPVVAARSVRLPTGAIDWATGSERLSRQWFFAEGTTSSGITTTLRLLNPWPQRVAVSLRIMSEDGTSLSRRYALPAQARLQLKLNELVPALPFALQLVAERPIIAERSMAYAEGKTVTSTSGAPALAARWTFVEGSTAGDSQQSLLVGSPHPTSVQLEVAYVLTDGTVVHRRHTAPPMSRLTLDANADVPGLTNFTTVVTASRPVVAERTIRVPHGDGQTVTTILGWPGE